jgi:hypothetical protein
MEEKGRLGREVDKTISAHRIDETSRTDLLLILRNSKIPGGYNEVLIEAESTILL